MKILVRDVSVINTGKKIFRPGDILELKEAEARKLIKRGVASALKEKTRGTGKTKE